jgi:hypothetical protein
LEVAKPETKMTQPNDKTIRLDPEEQASGVYQNMLEETPRDRAQRLLSRSIEREVEEYLQKHA